LARSGAVGAAPVIDAVAPANGPAGATVAITSADVQAGSSYFVFFGLAAVPATATEAGRLQVAVPSNLCAATYPVALIDSGVRSNTLAFQVTAAQTSPCSSACLSIVTDRVVVCPYRTADPVRHDLVFVGANDGRVYAAASSEPDLAADPVIDPLLDLDWQTISAVPAPGGERLLVVRRKRSCPTDAPGPGLACSYGRPTLWLALHWVGNPADPGDDFWVHLNLAPAYGLNSSVLAHPSWLHGRLALASVLVRPDDQPFVSDPTTYTPQIWRFALNADGFPSQIGPFAPAQLQRTACFTGRTQASQSASADACTAGQRLVFTRRCYDEPDGDGWTWWNSTSYDAQAARCVSTLSQQRVPILRTYVAELDASCTPTRVFEDMQPVRQPPRDGLHRQMGVTPEWGDMEPALSADGSLVALTTTTGIPLGDPANACLGFYYNLGDPAVPTSGASGRRVHVCALDPSDLTCAGPDDAMQPLGVTLSPPESQLRPGFVRVGGADSVVLNRQWSQTGSPRRWDLVRIDRAIGPDAIVPLSFAPQAAAPEVLHPAPSP
jgi:hypothetical protein